MAETWRKVDVPERLRQLEKPFLAEVEELLRKWSVGDDETYWYLSWRLEFAAIGRNLVDHTKVRRQLFDEQNGLCPECGQPLDSPKGHDVHKRQRMFAKHQVTSQKTSSSFTDVVMSGSTNVNPTPARAKVDSGRASSSRATESVGHALH